MLLRTSEYAGETQRFGARPKKGAEILYYYYIPNNLQLTMHALEQAFPEMETMHNYAQLCTSAWNVVLKLCARKAETMHVANRGVARTRILRIEES